MKYNRLLEDLDGALGNCGLYQFLISLNVHAAKILVTWSMLSITFVGPVHDFICIPDSDRSCPNSSEFSNETGTENVCRLNNDIPCRKFCFRNTEIMNTIVSQWGLVCDRKWIPATMMSLQMIGVLLGSLVNGHISDTWGRKPAYFMSLIVIVTGNLIGCLSGSWEMYAVMRFVIGVGIGGFMTVQYSILIEVVSPEWRSSVVALPSFAIHACLLALVAWLQQDWRKLQIIITIIGIPFIFTWFVMPESLRWLVTQRKFGDAEEVVKLIAKVNRVNEPNTANIVDAVTAEQNDDTDKVYTLLDVFTSRRLAFTTIGMILAWFSANLAYYGMVFGVSSLSRNVYLNMFLMFIVDVPILVVVSFATNSMGRKKVSFILNMLAAVGGVCVGILQTSDIPENYRTSIVTVVAMVAKLGVAGGCTAMVILAVEIYPTSIRTIACGVLNMAANTGGIIAPQIVILDSDIPGLLYFMSGGGMFFAAIIILFMRETNGLPLDDELLQEETTIFGAYIGSYTSIPSSDKNEE